VSGEPFRRDRIDCGGGFLGSSSFDAFRVRDHELDAGEAHVSLGELLSVAPPEGAKAIAIRQGQLEALVRMVPATLAGQFSASVLVGICVWGMVPTWQIVGWLFAALGLAIVRGYRAYRLRSDFIYARRRPPDARIISRIIILLAMMWLVPFGIWFPALHDFHQTILFLAGIGLMSVGTVTLTTLPRASIGYIGTIGFANMLMAIQFGSWPLFALAFVYAAVLVWVAITLGRRFYTQLAQRYDLIERGELVDLLREFEASGSGGIWELDAQLNLTHISDELAINVGSSAERLVGKHVRSILDPNDQTARLSEGMRTLFHHLESGVPFRDLAIPATASKTWWSLSGKPVRDTLGQVIGWRGVGSDITDVRLSGSDSVRAARRDPLTGLANRLLVREHLEEALLAQTSGQGECSLLLVDLDKFKLVNDTLGHAVGDQLLCAVARRLEGAVGAEAHVGRLGGDEFAIILYGDQSYGRLEALAQRIIADLSRTFHIGVARLHVGATIGIARGRVDGEIEEALMRAADLALYQAKEDGRGGFALFAPEMYERAENHRLLENDVREALSTDALSLCYQPIIDSETGMVVAREALLRWNHPVRGPIPPDKFIPIIEDAGLIHQIGDWVIREACREARLWDPSISIAVNVSAAQLSGSGLAETVLGAIAATGLTPSRLELEVTESIFIGDDLATLASLERLRALGVKLVLDDFGKGYSSFGYLSRAQFAKIKIEQAFVRGAAAGERDCIAIVGAIVALARGLGVATTAEGVETEEQAQAMREAGCSQLQGYLFGFPTPAALLGSVVRKGAESDSARRTA
jgi:diguanylate cyclase (GGDEF)-like protein/PAS domain S-box-containing protein